MRIVIAMATLSAVQRALINARFDCKPKDIEDQQKLTAASVACVFAKVDAMYL